MKVYKAMKKIAALGAGITLVGATILGAMAADLSTYPAPFVQNGQFNALIIVGDQAAAEDVVGAVDVGASLQYAMKQEISVSGGAGAPVVTISEGKKIDRTGDHLNYGEEFQDVLGAPLDNEDLPVILGGGTYIDNEGQTDNKEDYDERLYFSDVPAMHDSTTDRSGELIFAQDDSSEEEVAADYLYFNDNDPVYRYKLTFDTSVEYTNSTGDNSPQTDLEDTTIKLQGNDYTITDVQSKSDGTLTKITLLAGETIIWLQQGKVIKRTVNGVEHEVEVVDVNDNEDMCGISVDGDVVWVDKGQTQTINGVQIGVTDAVAVHAQLQDTDICKVNVGAKEIIIDDGNEVRVDGTKVSGSKGEILKGDSPTSQWDGLNITFISDDELFIAKDGSWADPILQNFEIKFGGVTKVTEELGISTSSDSAELSFYNNDGKQVKIPLYYNDTDNPGTSSLMLGNDYRSDKADGRLLQEGDNVGPFSDFKDIEGVMFLLVTSGKEAHVMEIASISTSSAENTTDIKDLTYGKVFEDKKIKLTQGNGYIPNSTIELGSLGTIILKFGSDGYFDAKDVVLNSDNKIDTKYGANLTIVPHWIANEPVVATRNQTNFVVFTEENDELDGINWQFNATYDPTDEAVELSKPEMLNSSAVWMTIGSGVRASKADKDTKYFVSEWGTLVKWNSDTKDDMTMLYPDDQVIGNAFVAPIGAVVSGGGEMKTVTLNPINIASKLASEIEGQEKSQNLIIVGGPAVNKAAAVVMGLEFPATGAASGISESTGLIKLYENGDKVAMVVAGWAAADTRRATTVVANYKNYALSGKEVKVTGTSLTDITVSAPTA